MKRKSSYFMWEYMFFSFPFLLFFLSTNTQGATRPDHSKILTTIVSTFTSYYIHLWPSFFPDKPLSNPLPSFDGRIVQYPTVENLRDYLSWRQVDCMFCFVLISLNFPPALTFPLWSIRSKGGWGEGVGEV